MPTLVRNPSSSPLTLPAPFKKVLGPGAGVVLALTVAQVAAAMGSSASAFQFSDAPNSPTDSEALGDYGGLTEEDFAEGSVTSEAIEDETVATEDLEDGAVTTAKIAADAVTPTKIDGSKFTALVAVDHADVSPKALMAADTVDRLVVVTAVCTESLAGDNAPTFDFGWDTDTDGLMPAARLAGATAGQSFSWSAILPAGKAAIATLGTGGSTTNDAGAFSVSLMAMPT